jgi:hypothetical protein
LSISLLQGHLHKWHKTSSSLCYKVYIHHCVCSWHSCNYYLINTNKHILYVTLKIHRAVTIFTTLSDSSIVKANMETKLKALKNILLGNYYWKKKFIIHLPWVKWIERNMIVTILFSLICCLAMGAELKIAKLRSFLYNR